MKKIIVIAAMVGMTFGIVNAQDTKTAAPAKATPATHVGTKMNSDAKKDSTSTVKTHKKAVKKAETKEQEKMEESKETKASTGATKMKKDGTPDKRHKGNKGAKTAHVKKDGSPDMRYKDNKAVKDSTKK